MDLIGKTIIVTGAAGGLGRAFALRLASEGALVVMADTADCTTTADQIRQTGGRCIATKTDVTDEESVRAMCRKAAGEAGGIDGIVNNAAIYANLKMAPFDEISPDDWDRVFNVNVKGVWICCKEVYPFMKERGGGSIVNISSASILEGNPYFAHYVASKGAVWALTRSIARNVGQHNIRANTITPGYTMTEASKGLAGSPEAFKRNYDDNIAARALHRAMEAEDVVGAALFLLGDESRFITGQNLNVDGGAVHY